jgi:drug/metabolite transporter (DMT)-like permease
VILTRRLALKQSTFSILLWMMVLQSAFYAVAVGLFGKPLGAWTSEALAAVAVLGAAGLGSQLCLVKALGCGEATMVMPLDFLRVPLIALVGWAFYDEALSAWVLGGAALIVAGSFMA